MKRWLLTILAGGILLVAAAGPALADAGTPGTTFPEQPGANVQTACSAVATNPGTETRVPPTPRRLLRRSKPGSLPTPAAANSNFLERHHGGCWRALKQITEQASIARA